MSPIEGVSEIVRLPRLGKIRVGIEKENAEGINYPEPTDYFVCPDEVKKVLGEKPKELHIMFPTEDIQQWLVQDLRCYSESGDLLCRGDGETALVRAETVSRQAGSAGKIIKQLLEMPCCPLRCPCLEQDYCRPVINMQFLLPDCPRFGVYQLDTAPFKFKSNISSFLEIIRGVCNRISMIPLTLTLAKQKAQTEDWMKIVYTLHLDCSLSIAQIQQCPQVLTKRVLILPPMSIEPVGSLFQKESSRSNQTVQKSSVSQDQLLDIWARIKNKIMHFEICDLQIAKWFKKNYGIEIGILDFEPPVPPEKLTFEMLSAFCQSIERYATR